MRGVSSNRVVRARRNTAIAFFDAMNLFYDVKALYGYPYPNFDPLLLARAVSTELGCDLSESRYYSGIHSRRFNRWQHSWMVSKANALLADGVHVYTRPLQYIDGNPQEKGIDLRLALDVVDSTLRATADTIIIFSRDQDFTELKPTIFNIARSQRRNIRLVSAFPVKEGIRRRGIDGFDWFRIRKPIYDACIDPRDYRPRDSRPRP